MIKRTVLLWCLIISIFMSAINVMILSTSASQIADDLEALSSVNLIFTAYLLTQAIAIPLFGKLSDIIGRKLMMVVGIGFFLIGTIFSGFSDSIGTLVVWRMIQGIGGGAIQPVAMIIISDVYDGDHRAKIQGNVSSVWALASIMGPILGGFLIEYFHWSWIFWINIPFGILALLGISLFYEENRVQKKVEVDFRGMLYLSIGIATFILFLTKGGETWTFFSGPSILSLILLVVVFSIFLREENHANNPIIPLYIWKDPIAVLAFFGTFCVGIIMISVIVFFPFYLSEVKNISPSISGWGVSIMSISWAISAAVFGKIIYRLGILSACLIGSVFITVGITQVLTLDLSFMFIGTGIIGLGIGTLTISFITLIQHRFSMSQRGIAISLLDFLRVLGSTVGTALVGLLL
ncbi:MFS transporter [Evansella tamaricis]|uniref:MFS transporter n=1 Tax=Evansella tamaricis TaxID=2069301 RepID=A0ABS6JJH4_9BACI|nr:MFS transporter [Evansella tamaricis]MBU9713688.1 MFS transporter [Evansella tamaricis]